MGRKHGAQERGPDQATGTRHGAAEARRRTGVACIDGNWNGGG